MVIKMAKPIAPTPTLEGKDAYNFLMEMQRPATKEEKEMFERIKKMHLPNLFEVK
jgi:hypothetical protein